VVDDEAGIRTFCSIAMRSDGIDCEEATDGAKALEALAARRFDLVLLDIDMPNLNGTETLKRLRQSPPAPNLKVVMFSGRTAADDMAQLLAAGADDFVPKPFNLAQLRARVKAALRLKDAQDRSDLLNRHLLTVNAELERNLSAKDSDLLGARNALVLSLARLVDLRSAETGAHLSRLQKYCRALGDEALAGSELGPAVDAAFVQTLEACVPLHDIGKVALPDDILKKPGKLDPEERLQMQTHTVVGAETLRLTLRGFTAGFLQMAVDIARSHHERYDGTGYPDRLAGEDIPLAARFVAVADVYDALRSRRLYKPPLPHHTAVTTIADGSPGQFDPKLLPVFRRCLPTFEQIFRDGGE
jgi:response regulator RpfG family c-di-GMP phosphodiesterase